MNGAGNRLFLGMGKRPEESSQGSYVLRIDLNSDTNNTGSFLIIRKTSPNGTTKDKIRNDQILSIATNYGGTDCVVSHRNDEYWPGHNNYVPGNGIVYLIRGLNYITRHPTDPNSKIITLDGADYDATTNLNTLYCHVYYDQLLNRPLAPTRTLLTYYPELTKDLYDKDRTMSKQITSSESFAYQTNASTDKLYQHQNNFYQTDGPYQFYFGASLSCSPVGTAGLQAFAVGGLNYVCVFRDGGDYTYNRQVMPREIRTYMPTINDPNPFMDKSNHEVMMCNHDQLCMSSQAGTNVDTTQGGLVMKSWRLKYQGNKWLPINFFPNAYTASVVPPVLNLAGQSSVAGDPYLFPVDGPPVKLPNQFGVYRMYQNNSNGIYVDVTVDRVDVASELKLQGRVAPEGMAPVTEGYFMTKVSVHTAGKETVELDLSGADFLDAELGPDSCCRWVEAERGTGTTTAKVDGIVDGTYETRTLRLMDSTTISLRRYNNRQIMNGMVWQVQERKPNEIDGLVYRNVKPSYFEVSGKNKGRPFISVDDDAKRVNKSLVGRGEARETVSNQARLWNLMFTTAGEENAAK